ncbi:hypothetical protein VNI00_018934 [Paramarasmius palmivorus]|uniref:Uncharacterized protein n=1 Tax=Paramarasmius palmivorus TaxID=297713 RepID=A0AAW0ATJ1_9AGAR
MEKANIDPESQMTSNLGIGLLGAWAPKLVIIAVTDQIQSIITHILFHPLLSAFYMSENVEAGYATGAQNHDGRDIGSFSLFDTLTRGLESEGLQHDRTKLVNELIQLIAEDACTGSFPIPALKYYSLMLCNEISISKEIRGHIDSLIVQVKGSEDNSWESFDRYVDGVESFEKSLMSESIGYGNAVSPFQPLDTLDSR